MFFEEFVNRQLLSTDIYLDGLLSQDFDLKYILNHDISLTKLQEKIDLKSKEFEIINNNIMCIHIENKDILIKRFNNCLHYINNFEKNMLYEEKPDNNTGMFEQMTSFFMNIYKLNNLFLGLSKTFYIENNFYNKYIEQLINFRHFFTHSMEDYSFNKFEKKLFFDRDSYDIINIEYDNFNEDVLQENTHKIILRTKSKYNKDNKGYIYVNVYFNIHDIKKLLIYSINEFTKTPISVEKIPDKKIKNLDFLKHIYNSITLEKLYDILRKDNYNHIMIPMYYLSPSSYSVPIIEYKQFKHELPDGSFYWQGNCLMLLEKHINNKNTNIYSKTREIIQTKINKYKYAYINVYAIKNKKGNLINDYNHLESKLDVFYYSMPTLDIMEIFLHDLKDSIGYISRFVNMNIDINLDYKSNGLNCSNISGLSIYSINKFIEDFNNRVSDVYKINKISSLSDNNYQNSYVNLSDLIIDVVIKYTEFKYVKEKK